MRRVLILYTFLVAAFLSPIWAFAQDMPTEALQPVVEAQAPADMLGALGMIQPLMEAFTAKNWAMVMSLIILLVVFVVKKYAMPKDGSKDQMLPLYSAGLGVLVSVASNLYMGQHTILESILAGVFVGNAASGFWDTFIKTVPRKLLKKKG